MTASGESDSSDGGFPFIGNGFIRLGDRGQEKSQQTMPDEQPLPSISIKLMVCLFMGYLGHRGYIWISSVWCYGEGKNV
jgi:hypothetical protein